MNKMVGLLGLFSLFLLLLLSQFKDVPPLNADAVSANNPIVVDGHLAQASYNLEFLGLTGGSTLVTAVQGSYLYAGIGSRFVVFDMAEPAVPTLVGEVQLTTTIRKIEVNDNYAVVVTASIEHGCLPATRDYYSGWYVIHLDNPTAPQPIFYQETDCVVMDIDLSDHYLYMALYRNWFISFLIFDLANPAYPVQLGEAPSDLEVVSWIATAGDTVYLAGTVYAYMYSVVVLVSLDVTNPAAPIQIGQWYGPAVSSPRNVGGLAIANGYANIGSFYEYSTPKLYVLDIANPALPAEAAVVDLLYPATSLTAVANTLYLTHGDQGVSRLDITNPIQPTPAGALDTPGFAVNLAANTDFVYVADSWRGLRVLDVTDPDALSETASYDEIGMVDTITIADSHAYIAGHDMRILDLNNPQLPLQTSLYETLSQTNNIVISGTMAAFAAADVQLVDVTNPYNPTSIGVFMTPGNAGEVVLRPDQMIVADNAEGVHIVDITNPQFPDHVSTYNTHSILPAATAALVGDHLLVGSPGQVLHSGPFNLVALNILTPTQPFQTGLLPGYIRQVTTRGHFVYMIDVTTSWFWYFNGNFAVVDVSDPTNLVQINNLETPGDAQEIVVSGNFAYIADGWAGLRLLDVWNPAQPVLAGLLATPCFAKAVAARAEYIYVGCGEDGLLAARRSHSQVQTTITAADGGSLSYTDGNGTVVSLQVPPGAVTETVDLVLVPVTSVRGPQGIAVVQAFDLLVYRAGGEQTAFSFLQPATLTITYDDAAVGIIIDENELSLQWGEAGIWVEAGSNCGAAPPLLDVDNNRVTAEICGNNRYALWGPTQQSFLPVIRT